MLIINRTESKNPYDQGLCRNDEYVDDEDEQLELIQVSIPKEASARADNHVMT